MSAGPALADIVHTSRATECQIARSLAHRQSDLVRQKRVPARDWSPGRLDEGGTAQKDDYIPLSGADLEAERKRAADYEEKTLDIRAAMHALVEGFAAAMRKSK
jgi:hypothetical protein